MIIKILNEQIKRVNQFFQTKSCLDHLLHLYLNNSLFDGIKPLY